MDLKKNNLYPVVLKKIIGNLNICQNNLFCDLHLNQQTKHLGHKLKLYFLYSWDFFSN